ncbi:MAG: glycosyltransferase, partial [Candidatus Helarchaeota archaeon]
DLSHPPEKILEFLNKIKEGYDLVLSSRYIKGGGTNQNIIKRLVSKFGNFYLSKIFKINIKDLTTCYRAFNKHLWDKLKNFKYSNENLFLVETVYFAKKLGARITDVPIFFEERKIGKSKTPFFREMTKVFFFLL